MNRSCANVGSQEDAKWNEAANRGKFSIDDAHAHLELDGKFVPQTTASIVQNVSVHYGQLRHALITQKSAYSLGLNEALENIFRYSTFIIFSKVSYHYLNIMVSDATLTLHGASGE
ncbi:unnamed protein product [Fasciola hepatica]|uniref:Uncharacterized protein n=1 Tax=Fasciola hepatica TaxID=6192 RepID=A0ABC9HJ78_FASHE